RLSRAPAPLHASALVGGASPAPVASRAAHRALRRGAQPHAATGRVPLPSPVPAGAAALPDGGAGLAGDRARPPDRLPPVRDDRDARRPIMNRTITVVTSVVFVALLVGTATDASHLADNPRRHKVVYHLTEPGADKAKAVLGNIRNHVKGVGGWRNIEA